MAGYLLDTNHLSAAIRKVSVLRERIRELTTDADFDATPEVRTENWLA